MSVAALRAVFLVIGLVSLSANLAAQSEAQSLKIAVIDVQRILSESLAVAKLTVRIEELRSTYRQELRLQEESFREADRNLARERLELDPETFALRRQALQERAGRLQREFDDRKRALDRLFRQGMAQIQDKLTEVSHEIAAAKKLDIVLGKATVLLVRPDLEITDVVLAQLNERMQEVDLPGLKGVE